MMSKTAVVYTIGIIGKHIIEVLAMENNDILKLMLHEFKQILAMASTIMLTESSGKKKNNGNSTLTCTHTAK